MDLRIKHTYDLINAFKAVINDDNNHTPDDVTRAWDVIDNLADDYLGEPDGSPEYYADLFRTKYEPIIEAMERFENDDHILELTAGCVWVKLRRICESLEWDLKEELNIIEFKNRLKQKLS